MADLTSARASSYVLPSPTTTPLRPRGYAPYPSACFSTMILSCHIMGLSRSLSRIPSGDFLEPLTTGAPGLIIGSLLAIDYKRLMRNWLRFVILPVALDRRRSLPCIISWRKIDYGDAG